MVRSEDHVLRRKAGSFSSDGQSQVTRNMSDSSPMCLLSGLWLCNHQREVEQVVGGVLERPGCWEELLGRIDDMGILHGIYRNRGRIT